MFGICSKSNGPFPVVILGLTFKERERLLQGKEIKGEIVKVTEQKSVIELLSVKKNEGNQARVTWVVGPSPEVIFRINDIYSTENFYLIQPDERLYQIHIAITDFSTEYLERFNTLKATAKTFVSTT